MDSEYIVAIIAMSLVATLVLIVTPIVFHYRDEHRKHETEIAFKREMLERGMSAEEIAIVFEAGRPKGLLDLWKSRTVSTSTPTTPRTGKPRISPHSEIA